MGDQETYPSMGFSLHPNQEVTTNDPNDRLEELYVNPNEHDAQTVQISSARLWVTRLI
jgi:hypothetical protein